MIGYSSRQPSSDRPRRRFAVLGAAVPALGPDTLLLGSVLLVALVPTILPVADPDFWMHSRAGLWTLQHGWPPTHDLFTYTVADHAWIDQEWLTQVLMRLAQDAFGLPGVAIALGLVTWAGLLLVVAASSHDRDGRRQPYVIVAGAALLAAVAGVPVWGPRPQMVTFALCALELLWLRRTVESDGRAIWFLPLVMVAWSNLHGGWPAGFAFLGVALVSELVSWAAGRDAAHLRRARRLAIVGVLSALALPINPNGFGVLAYPFETLGSAAQQTLIAEWQSPDFHLPETHAFAAMLLLLGVGLALGRPRLYDALIALAAAALALDSVRHIALFVAAATPVLVATWSDVWRRAAARRGWAFAPAPAARWMAPATAAVLIVVGAAVATRVSGQLAQQPQITTRSVPVGAADWLQAHPDVGTRMFDQYAWGSYLGDRFFGQPNRRVYVFSEGVVIGDRQLERYEQVAALQPGWQAVLDEDRVDYVVIGRGSALDDVLATEPSWRLAYRDATAVIYVRASAPTRP